MNDAREVATLGGGCFWCLEAVFENLHGVESVVSGYAGGHVPNPTYGQVCSKTTGHAGIQTELLVTFRTTRSYVVTIRFDAGAVESRGGRPVARQIDQARNRHQPLMTRRWSHQSTDERPPSAPRLRKLVRRDVDTGAFPLFHYPSASSSLQACTAHKVRSAPAPPRQCSEIVSPPCDVPRVVGQRCYQPSSKWHVSCGTTGPISGIVRESRFRCRDPSSGCRRDGRCGGPHDARLDAVSTAGMDSRVPIALDGAVACPITLAWRRLHVRHH
jgi:hypothetical protein